MKTTAIALLFPLLSPCALAQGSLTPPAGPEPMMKSLEQIEPRFDVFNAPDTRVDATDPQWAYVIKTPGSYYLSKNLTVGIFTTVPVPEERPNGIRIDASDVTLDLQGFTISSGPNVGDNSIAIGINNDRHRVTIHDGTIRGSTTVTATQNESVWEWSISPDGFTHGIFAMGDNDSDNQACRLTHITVSGCRQSGIDLGSGALVESCISTQNGGNGIFSPSGNIDRSLVTYNGANGLAAGGGSITNCVAKWNQGNGIENWYGMVSASTGSENGQTGIDVLHGTASHCFARGNNVYGFQVAGGAAMNCTAQANLTIGIDAEGGSIVNCNAQSNGTSGIYASDGAVSGSVAAGNGPAAIVASVRTGNYDTP